MDFVQEEKGYCDSNEDQEEEEEEEVIRETSKLWPFSSSLSSYASSNYKGSAKYSQNQYPWLRTFESQEEEAARSYHSQETAINFSRKLELMDLSLGNNSTEECGGGSSSGVGGNGGGVPIEREHMFDKVVTPSDVGKLNRLVIPKQHAEKYFPLDSSTNEKGLLLNFEDRHGKPWRFRYSYWNSSQSYVMTKGWSRFVKEKKLDAGDIVSFNRGVGELGKDRLYIDWRRRPDAPHPTSLTPLQLPDQLHFPQSVRWGRLYSLPSSMSMSISMPLHHDHLQRSKYSIHPYHHHHHYHQRPSIQDYNGVSSGSCSLYHSRSSVGSQQVGAVQEGGNFPMVIDSASMVHGKNTAAKRLRLFGVNMECPMPDDSECNVLPSTSTLVPHVTMASLSPHLPSSSLPSPLQLRLYDGAPLPTIPAEFLKPTIPAEFLKPTIPAEFLKKGKSSLSFDLDP